jgi:hypothetical protein
MRKHLSILAIGGGLLKLFFWQGNHCIAILKGENIRPRHATTPQTRDNECPSKPLLLFNSSDDFQNMIVTENMITSVVINPGRS